MSLFKTNLTGVPSLTSPPPSLLFFRAPFTSHRSPLSERLEQAIVVAVVIVVPVVAVFTVVTVFTNVAVVAVVSVVTVVTVVGQP